MGQELISLYQRSIGCSIDELAREILGLAKAVSNDSKICYRIKNSQILEKKMALKKVGSVFEIDDVYGLRVLVPLVEKSYEVLGAIMRAFPSFLDHDYIAKPKTRPDKPHLKGNGLRMLQIIARRNNVPFEVQITTFEFNEANESFHGQYHREKYSKPSPV